MNNYHKIDKIQNCYSMPKQETKEQYSIT